MPRTDPTTVKNTFDTSLTDSAISDWITRASMRIDDVEDADPSIEDAKLKELETLVAQHLAASQDPRHESESGASRSVEFQGETGEGMKSTKYGQAALELDPTGTLGDNHEFTLGV